MRWKPKPYQKWTRVFAFVPHWCEDTREFVWLEHVYRHTEFFMFDAIYTYRSAHPC